ncbi:MAG: helix-turn-helix domain-containing protein [Croceivirga sp.]
MEINYNFISTIDFLGCLQGLVLGFIVFAANRKNKKSTFFLALFVLIYAYCFIPILVVDLNIVEYYPKLLILPRPGEWLMTSLFLIYVQIISIFSDKKNDYWSLYPGIAILVLQLLLFFTPVSLKVQVAGTFWYKAIFFLGHVYSAFILYYTWRFVDRHITEVENQYSEVETKRLLWAKRFVLFGFGLFILHILWFALGNQFYFKLIYAIANVFMLYWASIYGIVQENVHSVIANETLINDLTSTRDDIEIPNEQLEGIVRQIDHFMKDSEEFTKKNLTISSVSEKLKIHPRQFSRAINLVCHENFNAYVNRYRVSKAEQLLTTDSLSNLSIEGIGIEVGFQSKSAFYSAFKKINGTTPNQYKAQLFT